MRNIQLLLSLLFIICDICYVNCTKLDNILDIEDYQFHFKTFEYKFNIKETHQIIEYPYNNDLNITLDIDFNETISLLFNNKILLDFFIMSDFTEITYKSSIQQNDPSLHRLLLNEMDEMDEMDEMNELDELKGFKRIPVKEGSMSELTKEFSSKTKKLSEKLQNDQRFQAQMKGLKDKANQGAGIEGDQENEKDLEKEVQREINNEAEEQEKNPYRNHAFDKGMNNGPHPKYPTLEQWQKYRDFNKRPPPLTHRSEYDEYKKLREKARNKAGELYDRFHGKDGDLALHDAESLKKRFPNKKNKKRGKRYKLKPKEYGPPPDEPRIVPYHHGKYIGVPQRKSWFMAQQFCREQYGTNLASITEKEQLSEIRHVCDEIAGYGHCWIGLRRPFGTWQDGKPVSLQNWPSEGVNNGHEEPVNCVELLSQDKIWNPQLCTVRRSFICEIPRKRTRGKYIAIGKTLSWESAENYCQRTYNTDLAQISNKKENRLAMNLCRDISSDMHHCWIGLINPFKYWTDGTPVYYTNYNKQIIPDHKGAVVHKDIKKGLPEPYGEDTSNILYPKAVAVVYGEKNDLDAFKMKPPDGKGHSDADKEPDKGKGGDRYKGKKKKKEGGEEGGEEVDENGDTKDEKKKKDKKKKKKKGKGKGNDNCTQINTSYGGRWDKTRCSFRHFFLCNNPGYKPSKKQKRKRKNRQITQDEIEEAEERGRMKERKRATRKRRKEEMKQKIAKDMTKELKKDLKKQIKKKVKKDVKKKAEQMHKKEEEELKEEGKEEKREQEGEQVYRRRLIDIINDGDYGYYNNYDDIEDDDDEQFIGGLMKKLGGAAKGLAKKGLAMAKEKGMAALSGALGGGGGGGGEEGYGGVGGAEDNNENWNGQSEGRSKIHRNRKTSRYIKARRRRRRRRRIRRRRRFKRWLKKHYGRGKKKRCGRRCPYHHMYIRTLPKDMHWSPLSGLLPIFGVQALHRPKKSPKIHIVAKVHLPKHRIIDDGYLDYDLLSQLLFNDNAIKNTNMKKGILRRFNRREKRIEKQIKREFPKTMENSYNSWNQALSSRKQKAKYRRMDAKNDERSGRRRRMMIVNGKEINMVSRCKILDIDYYYEVCLNYYYEDMSFSLDIKVLDHKILRRNKRRIFRDIMDLDQEHYKDYEIVEEEEDKAMDGYVLFEAIDGNLGYAIWKYEALDWHSVQQQQEYQEEMKKNGIIINRKHEYGNFENFNNYIRFNEEFMLIFNGEYDDKKCSVTLNGLPFKLCMKKNSDNDNDNDGIMLYFEYDDVDDILDPIYSFRMKEFIDREFKNSIFIFNDDINWDEINIINMNEYIEKCSYLHIAKICMKQNNSNHSMIASISFQLMNKPMILNQN